MRTVQYKATIDVTATMPYPIPATHRNLFLKYEISKMDSKCLFEFNKRRKMKVVENVGQVINLRNQVRITIYSESDVTVDLKLRIFHKLWKKFFKISFGNDGIHSVIIFYVLKISLYNNNVFKVNHYQQKVFTTVKKMLQSNFYANNLISWANLTSAAHYFFKTIFSLFYFARSL